MRLRHIAVLVAVFAGLLAACGREQTRLSVTARDFGFSGVAGTVGGGAVQITFKNEGKATHELAFLDIGDASFDTFRAQFPKVLQGGPFPSFMKRAAGAGELEPGKSRTTTVTLPKGKYLMMCALDDAPGTGEKTVKPHYELGMHQDVNVDGPDEVDLTAPDGVFHAKDYTFVPPTTLKAGKGEYAFVNQGPDQWHFMGISKFPDGYTPARAEAAFAKLLKLPEGKPPPPGTPEPEDVIDTFVFSPGLGQTFTATFEAGATYLAVCFIQDQTGGPPHAISHHMYKAFTVPAA
jgi:plastocyanin